MEYLNSRMRLIAVWDIFGKGFHWELQYRVKTWLGYQWVCAQYCSDTGETISTILDRLELYRKLDSEKKNLKRKKNMLTIKLSWFQKIVA